MKGRGLNKTEKKQVKKMVNASVETKRVDKVITTTTITNYGAIASGDMQLLNGISEGDASSNREGLVVSNQYLQLIVRIFPNTSATQDTRYRFIVFRGHMDRGASPTGLTDGILTSASPESFASWLKKRRYTILADRSGAYSATDNSQKPHTYRINKKLKFRTYYNSSGSTISDIDKGALFFVVFSRGDATNRPSYMYSNRITFKDA